MAYTARLSTKGQIVIPKAVREQMQVKEGDELVLQVVGRVLVAEPAEPSRLDQFLAEMHAQAKSRGVTREQVAAAVREVREEMYRERISRS